MTPPISTPITQLNLPAQPLARLYAGIVVTQFVVILILFGSSLFTAQIGFFRFGLVTTFGLQWPTAELAAQSAELLLYSGLFVMVTRFRPDTESLLEALTRRLLRGCLVILTGVAAFGYLRILGELQPWLADLDTALQLLTIVPALALYPLQMLYIRHAALAFGDLRTHSQTGIWIWLAPVLVAAAAGLMFAVHAAFGIVLGVVLLIVAIQYWNTLNRLRKRVNELLERTDVDIPIQIEH